MLGVARGVSAVLAELWRDVVKPTAQAIACASAALALLYAVALVTGAGLRGDVP